MTLCTVPSWSCTGCQLTRGLSISCCYIRIKHYMAWHQGICVNLLCHMNQESNLLTVPPGKPGKYGSRSFVMASANLWNSLRGERAAWLKNSPIVESFKINL